MISASELKTILSYCPETGIIRWKHRPPSHFKTKRSASIWNSRFSGKEAGSFTSDSDSTRYISISISGKRYGAHRIAWAIHHGEWPDGHIDHLNHQRTDNRISNLRVVTCHQNQKNQKLSKLNKSGITGVHWRANANRWEAKIKHNYNRIHLGLFVCFFDACCARKSAENRLGFHPNHGSPSNA